MFRDVEKSRLLAEAVLHPLVPLLHILQEKRVPRIAPKGASRKAGVVRDPC